MTPNTKINLLLLYAGIHVMHSVWDFFSDEVAGGFLHSDLAANCWRHMIAIPMQATMIMPIEEMHFTAGRPYIRM